MWLLPDEHKKETRAVCRHRRVVAGMGEGRGRLRLPLGSNPGWE